MLIYLQKPKALYSSPIAKANSHISIPMHSTQPAGKSIKNRLATHLEFGPKVCTTAELPAGNESRPI